MSSRPSAPGVSGFLLTLFGFEDLRSRRHKLLIVLVHATGWCMLFLLPVLLYPLRFNNRQFIISELINKSVLIAVFYFNYYWLIPRLVLRNRKLGYLLAVFLLFSLYLGQQVYIRNKFFPRHDPAFRIAQMMVTQNNGRESSFVFRGQEKNRQAGGDTSHGLQPFPLAAFGPVPDSLGFFNTPEPVFLGIPRGAWMMTVNNSISSFLLILLIGGFIRLAYSFIRNQNEKKLLENANLNAEVNFLKSQINPHFLFNTLNSIYSQAHARSTNTEFSILKLSELLRYVLYDSGENKVPLAKDLQYISNYIDLQRIRLSSRVTVNYTCTGNTSYLVIAPLLLITFIENTFKHGISYTQACVIDINISANGETIEMITRNAVTEKNNTGGGGLGLRNVQRRLDLLYPGKYVLDIRQAGTTHLVNLKIDLSND
ncbi:MAG: histidine kinase [Chitinophagaceae bacterium]|nr:MAG: histidine kinase [Chitinophagaceae bacterium]